MGPILELPLELLCVIYEPIITLPLILIYKKYFKQKMSCFQSIIKLQVVDRSTIQFLTLLAKGHST